MLHYYIFRAQKDKKTYYWNGFWHPNCFRLLHGCFIPFGPQIKLVGPSSVEDTLPKLVSAMGFTIESEKIEGEAARDLLLQQLAYKHLSVLVEI